MINSCLINIREEANKFYKTLLGIDKFQFIARLRFQIRYIMQILYLSVERNN